jgi:hypothetical protein
METVMPRLEWDQDQYTEVRSLPELDHLINELSRKAQSKMPFSVELRMNPETSLSIVVGNEISHINFFSAKSSPPMVGCHGPWNDNELLEFLYRGEYSEIPRRFCVPIADAREAIRRYFLTGIRPDNVAWNDNLR